MRNASMTGPEWTPCSVGISAATWDQFRHDLEDVVVRHPTLFPNFKKGERDYDSYDFGPAYRAGERFTDAWGCVWRSEISGIEGIIEEHPLDEWEKLETYTPPDPMVQDERGPADWDAARRQVEERRSKGEMTSGGIGHGFLFQRLYYLRGFENFMMDVANDDPHLQRLVDVLVEHSLKMAAQWLSMKVDALKCGDDLGSQKASVLGPRHFRRWIAPGYEKIMGPFRRAGSHVWFHTDGYVMDIMDQLIECGVTVINPQDLLNGIDNLRGEVKGRICIDLDVDRQKIVPFGTRKEIRDLIEEEVRKLGSPRGGLLMKAGIYPPTPPENIDALCCAMEEFRTYWWDGRARTRE